MSDGNNMATYSLEKKVEDSGNFISNFIRLAHEVKNEPFHEDDFEIVDSNFVNMFLSPTRNVDTEDIKFLKLESHTYQPLINSFGKTSGFSPKSNMSYHVTFNNNQITEMKQLRVEITKINKINCVKCGCELVLCKSLYLYFSYVKNIWQYRCLPCHFKSISGTEYNESNILINGQIDTNQSMVQRRENFYSTFQLKEARDVDVGYNTKKIECNVCNKILNSQSALKTHIEFVHERRKIYTCGECHKTFYRKGDMGVHIRSIHIHKYIHRCNICGVSFKQLSHLNRHIFSVHEKRKPFACEKCDYTCSLRESLKRHHDNHLGLKDINLIRVKKELTPVKCSLCDKTFSHNNSLKKHVIRVHDNTRAFVCFRCNRAFNIKEDLKVHINIVHSKIKKYLCHVCDRHFSVKGNLTTHVQRYHGQQ